MWDMQTRAAVSTIAQDGGEVWSVAWNKTGSAWAKLRLFVPSFFKLRLPHDSIWFCGNAYFRVFQGVDSISDYAPDA